MYEQFYGLKEKPFNMTPDPEFLFFTEKHKEAFAHLVYGIRERRGFIEITGEVGAGKTTLCRALINEFDEDTRIALVLNPFLSEIELIRTINEELFIDATGATKKELLDTLNHYLIDQHSKGRNVVVVIDEAQNLPIETLEQIRLISNLETVKAKLLQIVLVGQPELREKLSRPELRQLNQRITVRNHISSLSRQETEEYIKHRLSVAGSTGDIVFTKKALDEIHEYSKGLPRAINVICDHALLNGYVQETFTIDEAIVRKVRAEITGPPIRSLRKNKTAASFLGFDSLWKGALAGAATIVLIAGIALAAYALLVTPPAENAKTPAVAANLPELPSTESSPGKSTAPNMTAVNTVNDSVEKTVTVASTSDKPAESNDTEIMLASAKSVEPPVAGNNPPAPAEAPLPEAITIPEPSVNKAVNVEPAPVVAEGPKSIVPGQFDTEQVLRCETVIETFDAALLSAMRMWNVPEMDAVNAYASLAPVRGPGMASMVLHPQRLELLARHGFRLAPVTANLAMLELIDLPCLLETWREDLYIPEYVVLRGRAGENPGQVIVANPRLGCVSHNVSDLQKVWFGRCIFVVPVTALPASLMAEGSPQDEVRLLQTKLQRLGCLKTEPNGIYDGPTRAAVMAFQRSKRIRVDGIVGPETGLLLYAALAGTQTPRLSTFKQSTEPVHVALAAPVVNAPIAAAPVAENVPENPVEPPPVVKNPLVENPGAETGITVEPDTDVVEGEAAP